MGSLKPRTAYTGSELCIHSISQSHRPVDFVCSKQNTAEAPSPTSHTHTSLPPFRVNSFDWARCAAGGLRRRMSEDTRASWAALLQQHKLLNGSDGASSWRELHRLEGGAESERGRKTAREVDGPCKSERSVRKPRLQQLLRRLPVIICVLTMTMSLL